MKPLRIAVIGGGRWARIYLRLLLASTDLVASVMAVTPRNVVGLRAWAAAEGLDRLTVTADWPQQNEIDAAIVVNGAADHGAAAERLLRAGISLLVEKPFAANTAKAGQLVGLAAARGTYLAAAQVLRFAGYLRCFAALPGKVSSVALTWCDPASEQRYGDVKSHDAGLPLVVDMIPHILSILDILVPGRVLLCHSVAVGRGGSEADLRLMAGCIPVTVHLARNTPRRIRAMEVVRKDGRAVLDFTAEPGTIDLGLGAQPADPAWAETPSPLTQLVAAFLQKLAGGAPDQRLAAEHGVTACTLADVALRQADAGLAQWLRDARAGGARSEDLYYAAAEIVARTRNPALSEAAAKGPPIPSYLIDDLIPALDALRAQR